MVENTSLKKLKQHFALARNPVMMMLTDPPPPPKINKQNIELLVRTILCKQNSRLEWLITSLHKINLAAVLMPKELKSWAESLIDLVWNDSSECHRSRFYRGSGRSKLHLRSLSWFKDLLKSLNRRGYINHVDAASMFNGIFVKIHPQVEEFIKPPSTFRILSVTYPQVLYNYKSPPKANWPFNRSTWCLCGIPALIPL